MSYYTLFKGWLLLSQPPRFFALPVPTRLLFCSSTFPLVLKYVGSWMLGHAMGCDRGDVIVINYKKSNLLQLSQSQLEYLNFAVLFFCPVTSWRFFNFVRFAPFCYCLVADTKSLSYLGSWFFPYQLL